ncbi:ubiquitin-protein ligase [Lithospermum erythrorhizon]|uniref:Ubiquitin-protein ligase n=1 Tax=Lithospermum erythrorhizon TaxID=34254 RepID=A0AAV3Q3H1_LITER
MSNEDEKRCPLCAEEMDWTDQQFKPCKCGYQVCVWCWHHIMDMAEKADTEGRCPACRTIYEKEKIVTMQANCERMASKISNKKNKPPKAKPKTNEVKKDLTNIRVIQRTMAYVIGLPLDLADEDILQRKEYFGQYGKITKISLSRTAGGAIQQFVYDTCSVYVTYSKEEEAIRCIQSIHGFNMDGRLLRASFGTAKYCHAWLRNLPCNNPGCLYLHSFGAEEDSFSKDEAAAVQTRIRLQQVVGDANNSLGRSGNVLPLPEDELNNTTSASNLDPSPVGMSSSCHVSNMLQSKIKDGGIGARNKITTFVDVVGRPNSSDSEKDGNIVEDKRILNLCSDLSSLTFDKDVHDKKPYSGHRLYRASSSDHLMKGFYVESNDIPNAPYRENFRSLNIQGSNSCNNMSHRCFLHTSCPKDIQEGSVGQFFLYEMSHSASNYSKEHNSVPIQEDGAPPSITSVNSVPDDRFLETKFQSSAKTDRIYRGSNSFSNEEIVEHLRRIDDEDGNELNNGDENSSLADLERGVISDVVSRILDIGDDSSKLPNSLSDIDDDNKFHHSPSWNSQNSDNTCFPFVKQDIYATPMADYRTSFSNSSHMSSNCSLHLDLGESQDHYSYKSQIPASKPQIIAPPGFSKPRRDPPLGFSASERRDHFSRVSSGNHLMDNSAFLTTFLQNPSTNNGSFGDIDFNDPAILSCGKCRTANGLSSIGFELKGTSPSPQNGFGDEERLWNLMQQSNSVHKDIKLTQSLLPQALSTHQQTCHRSQNGDCISNLDEVYGFSSRLTEKHQAYDPSSLTSLSQQNFLNGHISSSYRYSSDGDQLRNEVSMPDLQRNESLGFSKYFPGYGDMRFQMPVSGDIYTRLFGM